MLEIIKSHGQNINTVEMVYSISNELAVAKFYGYIFEKLNIEYEPLIVSSEKVIDEWAKGKRQRISFNQMTTARMILHRWSMLNFIQTKIDNCIEQLQLKKTQNIKYTC